MRRLVILGFFMLAGFAAGLLAVDSNSLLGGFMGAAIGFVAALIGFAFPRERDYPEHNNSEGILGR